jgi:hypothetical protein
VIEGCSPPLGCHAARCMQACVTYPVLLVGCVMWRLSELWLESVDAGAAVLEVGLRGRLSGERRGGGDGSFLWPCGWRGEDVGDFGVGGVSARQPRIVCRRPSLETTGVDRRRGAARRFFRAKAQCFGTIGGDACYLLRGRAPGENP